MLPAELASLSEELLEGYLRERLPSGWKFEISQDDTDFWVVVLMGSQGETQWKISDITPKQVFLHAIGWLSTRNRSANPSWVRRSGEITQQRLHEAAFRTSSPDSGPEDLDPSEVASVYSCHGGKHA